jgi:hypothetical protein
MLTQRLGAHVRYQNVASVRHATQHRLCAARGTVLHQQLSAYRRRHAQPPVTRCASGNGSSGNSGSSGKNGAAPETPPPLPSSRYNSRCCPHRDSHDALLANDLDFPRLALIDHTSVAVVMTRPAALRRMPQWTCRQRNGALPLALGHRRTSAMHTVAPRTWCCRALRTYGSGAPGALRSVAGDLTPRICLPL